MKNTVHLNIIVIALLFSLIGIVAIQVYWIRNAFNAAENQFNQNVNVALDNVVAKMDKERYSEDVLNFMVERVAGSIDSVIVEGQDYVERRIEIIDSMISSEGGEDSVLIRIIQGSSKNPLKGITAEARLIQEDIVTDSIKINDLNDFRQSVSGPSFNGIPNGALMRRIHMMGDVLLRFLDPTTYQPAERKIVLSVIDSMLEEEFGNLGIASDFEFSIAGKSGEEVRFESQKSNNYKTALNNPEFSIGLFPNDYSQIDHFQSLILQVSIPNKLNYLLGRIWWILALSVFFILIICYAFYYTVATINRQKKLSIIKNDFINNMTHELKTPISTIALACEALSDPDFSTMASGNNAYINMIRDENVRLGVLVERVLQSSVIEKGELKTKEEPVQLNSIIKNVAQKFKIQIDKLGGTLDLNLHAETDQFTGDKVHLTNLFSNLIDNGVKYSNESPGISINTYIENNRFVCKISDKGIGISKEFQKKIFDRLFRVPTGNVHDVKGFGLGLSYVKAIVDHHNATIAVHSNLGHGSTFTITFPQ